MRKDWWILIVLAVCFVLLVVVLFLGEGVRVKLQQGRANGEEREDVFDYNPDEGVVDSGGLVGLGSVDGEGLVIAVETIPDIASVECGFYFEEYGVCAGTCPDGECVSEGRSCYCKKT